MITACMIVRDEEERLPACLKSIEGLWDQLVVVDTGSVDETINIAKAFGAQVEHFEWVDDYAAARNYAETFATEEYIFWIDGDETLVAGYDRIRGVCEEGLDAVRPICIVKRDQYGAPTASHCRQELLRKKGYGQWVGKIHEYIECPTLGSVEREIQYEHHERTQERATSDDDHMPMLQEGLKKLDPRAMFYMVTELFEVEKYVEAAGVAHLLLLMPNRSPFERSLAAMRLGDAMRRLGNADGAREGYFKAMTEFELWAEPYFSLGGLYYDLQMWQKAELWLTASLVHSPPDEGFYDASVYTCRRYALLALTLEQLGRLDEAAHWMGMAVEGSPENAEYRQKLAEWEGAYETASAR